MDVTIITQLVGQLGFPIFVALYVLWRLDGQIQQISSQLQHLSDAIDRLDPQALHR